MKVVIFAANGYIGKVLCNYFAERGNEVIAVTRRATVYNEKIINLLWDGKSQSSNWNNDLEGTHIVINLAGKSVNCRYNDKNKKEIFDSRTFSTEAIGLAIRNCKNPPGLWINSASATIYRHAEDRPMDEITGEIGTGFSVEVCKKWEKTFFGTQTPDTRKVALRMAIVLGDQDGVFVRLKRLAQFGLGGRQGSGKQMFSWIHDEDICRIVEFIYDNKDLAGVYNASSPNPVTNDQIMSSIRKGMGISFGLPSPKWLLSIGALVIGTELELIFKSRWVVPKKLLDAGFTFNHPTIELAIGNILKK